MAGPRQGPPERDPCPPGPDDPDPQTSGMLVSSSFHQYRTAPLPAERPDKNSPRAKGRAPVLGLRSEGAQRPSDEGEGRGLERPAASGKAEPASQRARPCPRTEERGSA